MTGTNEGKRQSRMALRAKLTERERNQIKMLDNDRRRAKRNSQVSQKLLLARRGTAAKQKRLEERKRLIAGQLEEGVQRKELKRKEVRTEWQAVARADLMPKLLPARRGTAAKQKRLEERKRLIVRHYVRQNLYSTTKWTLLVITLGYHI